MYSVSRYSVRGNARYAFGSHPLGDIASWVGVGEDGDEEYVVVCVVARHHVARAAHTLAVGCEARLNLNIYRPVPRAFLLKYNRLWCEI